MYPPPPGEQEHSKLIKCASGFVECVDASVISVFASTKMLSSMFHPYWWVFYGEVTHTRHGKSSFPRQRFLFHGKNFFSTAKLSFPRKCFLFHGKTFLSQGKTFFLKAKLTFSKQFLSQDYPGYQSSGALVPRVSQDKTFSLKARFLSQGKTFFLKAKLSFSRQNFFPKTKFI